MPGTHLLPPNLLKLFAPRPPLPYTRPLDRDINRVKPKNVDGVGRILAQVKEDRTQGMIDAAQGDSMEEGEEVAFTHAEETKRAIRREERKQKRIEDFNVAKEICMSLTIPLLVPRTFTHLTFFVALDKPQDDPQAVGDPYKTLFVSRLVLAPSIIQFQTWLISWHPLAQERN